LEIEIIHDEQGSEFYCLIEGLKSFLSYSENNSGLIEIYHTFVPPGLRNRGIAGKLIAGAVLYAQKSGKKIIATCSYAENYFARHPEFKELLLDNNTFGR
jgi:hypothetical protein